MGRFFRSDRIIIWIWAFVFIAWCCISYGLVMDSYAADVVETEDTENTSAEIIIRNVDFSDADHIPDQTDCTDFVSYEQDTLTLVSVSDYVTTISASDTSGFKAIVLSLIGPYEMLTKDYTYQSSQGYTSHAIETESDYAWLCSCGIFIIIVYCFLRILGGVICGRN